MEILTKEGILAPLSLPAARLISPLYKSPDGYWVGLSGRARIILYNTKLVKPDQVPISIFQLVDPVWKDKIAIAGTQERTTLSWVSGLVALKGETSTRQYIQGLLKNGLRILPDNTDVWQGVGKGEFAIGLTNSPNYHLALAAGYPVGVVYPDQGSADIGTQVNPIAVALVKGSTRAPLATRFVEYLLSADAQSVLTRQDFEIPLSGGADPGPVKPLAAIRQMEVSQPRLAELADPTLAILTSLSKDW
jgi:iron(III) transport system substrate-binding protein